VKSGTIFDNVLITDDAEFAKEFGDSTWGKTKVSTKTCVMFYLFNCICSYQLSFSQLCSTIYGLQKEKLKKKCRRSEHW